MGCPGLFSIEIDFTIKEIFLKDCSAVKNKRPPPVSGKRSVKLKDSLPNTCPANSASVDE
jgi:hypothetical protein